MFKEKRTLIFHLFLSSVLCFCLLFLIPMSLGNITFSDVIAIANMDVNALSTDAFILWQSRIPRVLMAMLTGGALSLSGIIFQAVLRNPLSEPYLLGVSAGAAFGKILFSLLILYSSYTLSTNIQYLLGPLTCFLGGIVPIAIMASIYFRMSVTPASVILIGLMLNVLFMSGVMLFQYLADFTNMKQMQIWWLGSLDVIGYGRIAIAAPILITIWAILVFASPKLNLLSLDFDTCKSLGVNPKRTSFYFLFLATILASLAVSMAGPIAFVGLIVPHLLRLIFGADNRFLVTLSFIYGGIFLSIADFVGQTSFYIAKIFVPDMYHFDIPVGIITSIIGAIMFLALLIRQKNCNYL